MQVGDFNGDGKGDITARTLQGGEWWTGISTGTSFNAPTLWVTWNTAATWVDVQVGDFNGDGKADIAGRYLQGGQWWVDTSNGTSFSSSLWDTWSTAVNWSNILVGDFNGDGFADITGMDSGGNWWTALSTGTSFVHSNWSSGNPWPTASTVKYFAADVGS